MRRDELKSIDDYEICLNSTLETWSPEQRVAFAAAVAERWLPVYEKFSAKEKWGDPASLRRSLDAIWGHVCGRRLAASDRARYSQQAHECTPHMDDFDAPEALAACVIVQDALKCCGSPDNGADAVQAALSGFEAAMPDWAFDPEEQPRLWKKIVARKELRKQLKLVEQIAAWPRIDDRVIGAFRKTLTSAELIGEPAPPPSSSTTAAGITNQQAFEQYRNMVQADLKSAGPLDLPGVAAIILRFAAWAGRYSRRRQTIDGSYGRLADTFAHPALVARQRARDAAEAARPTWDRETQEMLGMCFSNPMNLYDVKSPLEPHGYGPSIRRLWAVAKRANRSDQEAWADVVAWGRHRPAAWDTEDKRKKRGQAYAAAALGEHLGRSLAWTATGNIDFPWVADVDGVRWQVRLNDFPDEVMYTLFIANDEVGNFHDWPETWKRG